MSRDTVLQDIHLVAYSRSRLPAQKLCYKMNAWNVTEAGKDLIVVLPGISSICISF